MAEEENVSSRTYAQHPIPQNVMGVEFKLVGGLTLRQFGVLLIFVVVAFVVYQSGLPSTIRLPLTVVISLLGTFLSIVPIQDRPADVWLRNFLMAVSAPTERVWKKGPANLDVFFELREARTVMAQSKEIVDTKDRSQLRELLRRTQTEEVTPQDLAETEFLKSIYLLEKEVVLPQNLQPSAPAPPLARLPDGQVGGPPPAPVTVKISTETKTYPEFKARGEIDVTQNLASEVNFFEEKIISLPTTSGRRFKFITPIQNTRIGRRLRLVKPGEVGLGISGEKVVAAPEATSVESLKAAESLAQKIVAVEKKIQEAVGLKPKPLAKPTTAVETQTTPPSPILTPEKPTAPEPIIPTPPSPISAAGEPETIGKAVEAGRIALLSEELEKIKNERQGLLVELEKQKRARSEAETLASLTQEYQRRASQSAEQNSRLSGEIKKAAEEFKRLKETTATTQTEKETLIKEIKNSEKRVEELTRERTQATDNLINLQKELRELRIRQRFPPPPAKLSEDQTKVVAPPAGGPARPKPPAFIKDEANVINGYVKGKGGNLIKNAVIIVKDGEGSPVRALKSNELGQFAIATPVPNGVYTVEASATDETFDIITVEVYGALLEPLEFTGK